MEFPAFSHSPIDIHSHFNHGSPFDTPQTQAHLRSLEPIRADHARFGIYWVGMSTYASLDHHPACVAEENEYLHRRVQEEQWMYQWVVIDPRQAQTYAQAARMLEDPKVLGIKIHPSYHGYDILEHGDALFSFAQAHSAVVLMHPQHIPQMPALADRYPGMKLIIAHLRNPEHVQAMVDARHGNIYVDTSGSGMALNNILEHAVSQAGSEKILFGTDTYACAYAYPRVALADIPTADKENILWKNALRLFPRAFR